MSTNNKNEEQTECSNLQNNFIKQQIQISALKELVRKTEITNEKTNYTQEKVKNIAQRLTHIKTKARTRQNQDISFGNVEVNEIPILPESADSTNIKISSEKTGSEKFSLLRQQMKQNKLKMAERENTKKEIEEMVVQLKAKIDSTQISLDKSSELGRSMTELNSFSGVPVTRFKSSADLSFIPLNIDKERIKFLENRIRLLDKQLENDKELINNCQCKNQIKLLECKILDLMESLREKESIIETRKRKDETTDDLFENSTNEVFQSQNNFSQLDENYLNQIESFKSEILNLKEINEILEQTRFDLTIKNSELELQMQDLQNSFAKMEGLNECLQNQIFSLMNQKTDILPECESEYLKLDKQNNEDVQDEIFKNIKDTCKPSEVELAICLEMEKNKFQEQLAKNQEYEELLLEKDVEYNVLKANFLVLEEKIKCSPKTLFSQTTDNTSEMEINKLKQQLDDSNKSMIKLKLKTKQLQKQVDGFGKISNVNNELVVLLEQNQKLQQKINNLQDENHQLQLNMVTKEDEINIINEDTYTTCQSTNSIIQADRLQQLEIMKNKLYTSYGKLIAINKEGSVIPDIESITLEEITENFNIDLEKLNLSYNKLKQENLDFKDALHECNAEKQCVQEKNEYFISENIHLLDKIEKLNKSNSSAESIEFVEPLTQQEKDEIAEYEQSFTFNASNRNTNQHYQKKSSYSEDMDHDLNNNLVKLREESSELMYKIELFTIERREVLDKMEILSNDNQEHIRRAVLHEKEIVNLQNDVENLKYENSNLENEKQNISDDNIKLNKEINDLRNQKITITEDVENIPSTFKKCDIYLQKLHTEIENYKKLNDKGSKIQASKKLVKVAEITIRDIKKLIQINKSELQDSINAADLQTSSHNLTLTSVQDKDHEIQDSNLQLIFDTKVETLKKEIDILKSLNKELKEQLIDTVNIKQLIENNNGELQTELNNKQETVDTLNSQLMNLYDAMDKKTANLLEKEDTLFNYQEIMDANVLEINRLRKENNENKVIFENNLHSEADKLRNKIAELEEHNLTLETKTVNQLDKLKKFAANIKKKNLDCNKLEEKIKYLEQKQNSDQKLLQEYNDLQNKISCYENEIQQINFSKTQEIQNISKEQQLLETNLALVKMELDKKNQELDHLHFNFQSIINERDALKNANVFQLQNIESEKKYLEDLSNQINIKDMKLEEFKSLYKEKNNEVEKLQFEYAQVLLIYDKSRKSFHDKIFKFDTLYEIIKAKLNEYVSYVELLESEHKNYKNIIFELEDIVLSFEKNSNILNTQYQNKTEASEIKKPNLISRIQMLLNYDDICQKNVILQDEKQRKISYIPNLNQQNSGIKFGDKLKLQDHNPYLKQITTCDEIERSWIRRDIENSSWKQSQEVSVPDERSELYNFKRQLDIATQHNEIGINAHQLQISESDLLRIQVSQNQTDDQALIENENKRLKDSLEKKQTEIEMYQTALLQLQPPIILPKNLSAVAEVTNTKFINMQNKCDILTKEIIELKTVIDKKDEQLNNLKIKLNQINANISISENLSMFDTEKSLSNSTAESAQSINDKCKIEDLQRNVSDLEKYVQELEDNIKLPSKMNVDESLQVGDSICDYNLAIKKYEERIKNLENKLEEAIQKNIENMITTDNSTLLTNYDTLNKSDLGAIEPVIVPKKTYLCEPGAVVDSGIWNENKSYEEILESNEALHTIGALYETETKKAQCFAIRIEELELEQKRLHEEKQALHIKSAKMLKKLKEYKLKIDQQKQFIPTGKSISAESVDLDLAIQEEMKNQICRLEKNTTEIMKNLETEKFEKNNLLKRINTLTAANARLVEIKERQDIEINSLQIRELNVKASSLGECGQKIDLKYKKDGYSFEKDDQRLIQNPKIDLKANDEEPQTIANENQKCLYDEKTTIPENNNFPVGWDDSVKFNEAEILKITLENQNLKSQSKEYECTIEKLEIESVATMKKIDILVEEFGNKLNENLKINRDLELTSKSNTIVKDISLNLVVQNSVIYENKISEFISQLQDGIASQFKNLIEDIEKENQTCYIKQKIFETNSPDDDVLQATNESYNSSYSRIGDRALEKNTMEKETKILNERVLFCISEIETKCKNKIREFGEIWAASILGNGCISHESVNILENKFDQLHSTTNKGTSKNIQINQIDTEEENLDIIKNMTKALENQELEIVTLKDQLALRSGQRDPYAQISYSLESSLPARNSRISNNKSELDLTLYMLHQRDMRCEELQMELMNLLEERDTLQLKLSDAIRQHEEFKHKFVKFNEDNQFLYDKTTEMEIPFKISPASLQEPKYEVNTKLSQLYSVGNTKDENIDNRDRNIERMQQDVANIPTEAVTELVGVDMTNSTQSASTLLLNWLWGKSLSNSE